MWTWALSALTRSGSWSPAFKDSPPPAEPQANGSILAWEKKLALYKPWSTPWHGRVNVIAGAAAVHPREILFAASTAENAGANGVFPTPIYYPAGDEIVLQHYVQVKNACIIPVIAYNIPSHTANEITSACVSRLVNESVIAGIKDSTALIPLE